MTVLAGFHIISAPSGTATVNDEFQYLGAGNPGNTLSAEVSVESTNATLGTLNVGDTLTVDGNVVTISQIVTYSVTIVENNGTMVTHGVPMTKIVLSDGTEIADLGDLATAAGMGDGNGFDNVSHIYINGQTGLPNTYDEIDPAQSAFGGVGIANANTTTTVHDAIAVNPTLSAAMGSTFVTANGDLVEVTEPLVFNTSITDTISEGDTVTINGTVYTVTGVSDFKALVDHSDGAGGTTTSQVEMANVTLSDGTTTFDYLIPTDSFGDLPEITQIQLASEGNVGSFLDLNPADNPDTILDGDDTVTLFGAGGGTVTIYDAIELANQLPLSGSAVLTTAGGDLVEVDEPLQFSVGTPGQIGVGDTVTIGGVTYTVDDTFKVVGDYTVTGGAVNTNVYGFGLHLSDGGGNTLDYLVPLDSEGNQTDITQISLYSEHGAGAISIVELDTNDTVTLAVCFVRGTRIWTDRGEIPIERLAEGDLVETLDHGLQPIRWVGSSKRQAKGDLAPIRIRKGTLGAKRDLLVSPQHRMLISGPEAELLFGESEVLASAKSLLNDHSITRVEGGEVEYFHILFGRHEVIFAEGAPSESFHPGEMGWKALDHDTRHEILSLFPELESGDFKSYGPAARPSLKIFEAKLVSQFLS